MQSLLGYRSKDTVPARFPLPAGAETVTESFGTQRCALVSDEATVVTITSSSVSVHGGVVGDSVGVRGIAAVTATQW